MYHFSENKVEKDVEGKEEELFGNHVIHIKEKEMGLNAKVFEEKNNKEDYIQSVETKINTNKIAFSYKEESFLL